MFLRLRTREKREKKIKRENRRERENKIKEKSKEKTGHETLEMSDTTIDATTIAKMQIVLVKENREDGRTTRG